NPLRPVAVMHVPINYCDTLDFRIIPLRVTSRDRHVVEETESHRAVCGRMMTGRSERKKSVLRLAFHKGVNCAACAASAPERCFERAQADGRISVQKPQPFTHSALHSF